MLKSVSNAFTGLFGSRNQRLLKTYGRLVNQINALESELESLDDAALKARSAELKDRVQAGTTVDEALPEAFALVR